MGRTAGMIGGLVLLGIGASAHAETPKAKPVPGVAFTARDEFAPGLNQWGVQSTRRSLQFDTRKGKWGLKLDSEQNMVRDLGWNETGAGAYYKVTPSLRVGGGVSVNSGTEELNALAPQQRAPKVKLETSFKF
ncbi:MAG: NtrZ family periplasmic regulatory protein [Caulobacteraceae bacterium]